MNFKWGQPKERTVEETGNKVLEWQDTLEDGSKWAEFAVMYNDDDLLLVSVDHVTVWSLASDGDSEHAPETYVLNSLEANGWTFDQAVELSDNWQGIVSNMCTAENHYDG